MNNPQSITTFARRKYNGYAGRRLCTVSQPAVSWCWPGKLLSNIRTPFQGRCGMAAPLLNKAAKPSKPCWGFSERASENPQPNQNGFSQMQDEVMESFCTRWWHIIIEGTDRPWQINIKLRQAFRGQGAHPPDRFLKHHDCR
jgi:hypothetical protein